MKLIIKIISALIFILAVSLLISLFAAESSVFSNVLGFNVEHSEFVLEGIGAKIEFSLTNSLSTIVAWFAFIIVLMILAFYYAEALSHLLKKFYQFVITFFKTSFKLIAASRIKYILLIPTLAAIYSAYMLPVMYDETLTYYDFVKPDFWYGLFFYPYPNNHVFLSLILNISNELPIDLLLRLRLPSLLASLLTWIIAYRFIRKYYGEHVALFVVGLCMVCASTFYYGILARGYVLAMLFTVVCLYAAFNIIHEGNKRKDWLIFAFGGILGAFTIPSFLYPFATISVFIFIYNFKHIRTQIAYSFLVGIGVIFLYFPVLTVGGIEALAKNGYVLPISRLDVLFALPGYYKGIAVNIFYLSPIFIAAIFLIVGINVLLQKDKKIIILWTLFLLAPFVLLMLHAVIPFFRVFYYYGFILVFLIGIGANNWINKISNNILLALILVLQIAGLSNFFLNKEVIMLDSSASEEIVEFLIEDGKKYYFHSGLETEHVEGNLKFEGERRGINIITKKYWMNDVDKSELGYDYYLVLKEHDYTQNNKPALEMIGPFGKPINIYLGNERTEKKE